MNDYKSQGIALFRAGMWLHIPFSAVLRIPREVWLSAIGLHCDKRAEIDAELGCFARCIVVVGRKRAQRHVKGWRKILTLARRDTTKTILRQRVKSLRWQTKYFPYRLP